MVQKAFKAKKKKNINDYLYLSKKVISRQITIMIIIEEYRFEKHGIYEEITQISSVSYHSVNLFLLFFNTFLNSHFHRDNSI